MESIAERIITVFYVMRSMKYILKLWLDGFSIRLSVKNYGKAIL